MELGKIGRLVLNSQGLITSDAALPKMDQLIAFASGCCETVDSPDCFPSRDNGNGRTVRNIVEALSRAMAHRVISQSKAAQVSQEDLVTLKSSDIEKVTEQQAEIRLLGPCGQAGLVQKLSSAATKDASGLRAWFSSYKLSDPAQKLHTVVRETGRMAKSLASFESKKLGDLQKQCNSGLAGLVDSLSEKIEKTCGTWLEKLSQEVTPEKALTVKEFQKLVGNIETTSLEAKLLQRLLTVDSNDRLPAPLDKLESKVSACSEGLRKLQSQSLLAPLEATVAALAGDL